MTALRNSIPVLTILLTLAVSTVTALRRIDGEPYPLVLARFQFEINQKRGGVHALVPVSVGDRPRSGVDPP